MDAVQKVGNGHPGTAMSLAPAAYLLFQKVMRHDPADPRLGRPRPVRALRRALQPHPLHPALPGGFGLELDDLKALRTWGSQDPGPPRVRPHRRRRDHHRPARPGRRQRGRHGDGRPPRARPARPRRRRRASRPFDHHIYAICSRRRPRGGRHRRGLLARRHPAARQPDADLRRQPHLDRGRHRRSPSPRTSRARYEAYGWHVQHVDWTHDGTELRRGRPGALRRARRRRRGGHRPAQLHRAAHDHRLAGARTRRTPARRTARRSATTRSRPPRRSSASTRSRPSRSPTRCSRTPARLVERGQAARRPSGSEQFDAWADGNPRAHGAASTGCAPAPCPTAGTTRCRVRRPTPRASPPARPPARCSTRSPPVLPELWGGSADLAESQQHHDEGRAVVPARPSRQTKEFPGDPYGRVLHFGIREHAHGRDHERHRAARRHPRLRRHVPGLLRLHAPARSGSPR